MPDTTRITYHGSPSHSTDGVQRARIRISPWLVCATATATPATAPAPRLPNEIGDVCDFIQSQHECERECTRQRKRKCSPRHANVVRSQTVCLTTANVAAIHSPLCVSVPHSDASIASLAELQHPTGRESVSRANIHAVYDHCRTGRWRSYDCRVVCALSCTELFVARRRRRRRRSNARPSTSVQCGLHQRRE